MAKAEVEWKIHKEERQQSFGKKRSSTRNYRIGIIITQSWIGVTQIGNWKNQKIKERSIKRNRALWIGARIREKTKDRLSRW